MKCNFCNKIKCHLCNRKIEGTVIIWNIQHYGFKNMIICEECDLSIEEQIYSNLYGAILKEVKNGRKYRKDKGRRIKGNKGTSK
jgi:hypothetical protein